MSERHPSCEVIANLKFESVPCSDINTKKENIPIDEMVKAAEDAMKLLPKEKNPYEEMRKAAARIGFEDQPELIQTAESMGITPAKLKAMREYAANLVKQDKKMKQSTVRKKVLEKFKIKLV